MGLAWNQPILELGRKLKVLGRKTLEGPVTSISSHFSFVTPVNCLESPARAIHGALAAGSWLKELSDRYPDPSLVRP